VCGPNVTITIKVTDAQDNPVSGANVVVTPTTSTQCISGSLSGVTDGTGLVTFTLPIGTYSVSVSKNGVSTTQTITVSTSGQAFTVVLNTTPGGLIPGFPVESILAGLALGLMALAIVRRRRSIQ
jgi:azurin